MQAQKNTNAFCYKTNRDHLYENESNFSDFLTGWRDARCLRCGMTNRELQEKQDAARESANNTPARKFLRIVQIPFLTIGYAISIVFTLMFAITPLLFLEGICEVFSHPFNYETPVQVLVTILFGGLAFVCWQALLEGWNEHISPISKILDSLKRFLKQLP